MLIAPLTLITLIVIAFMLGMITAFIMMVNALAKMKSK
jgi:hypothetical protein